MRNDTRIRSFSPSETHETGRNPALVTVRIRNQIKLGLEICLKISVGHGRREETTGHSVRPK
jgi:hypothetical protein